MSKEVKRFTLETRGHCDCGNPGFVQMVEQKRGRFVCYSHVRDIIAERDALLAELDALKKDAERYRWLRQRLVGASFDWDDEGMTVLAFEMPDGVSIGADCDKTIDAALQGEQP